MSTDELLILLKSAVDFYILHFSNDPYSHLYPITEPLKEYIYNLYTQVYDDDRLLFDDVIELVKKL